MKVTQELIDSMIAEAQRSHPRECCGILLGMDDCVAAILPTPNVHPMPETHFEIDPQALVDAHRTARNGGPEVVGYYHSHPNGLAEPSATDRARALGDGSLWAIIARGQATFWRDGDDGFVSLPYRIADR